MKQAQKHIVLLNDKTIIELDFAKYRDLSVSRRSIICLCLRQRQIIDLLATNKSRYFAQPRPIIVYYHSRYFIRRFNWPRDHYVTANNCLRIIVCSCVLRCEVVLLQIILLVRSLVTCSEFKLNRGQVSH